MKKADTLATPLRKKMPKEIFEKIWRNEMAGKEAEWKEWVVFDSFQGIRRANISNVEVEGNILIEKTDDPLLHLVLSNCHLPNCDLINAKIRYVAIQDNSTTGDIRIEDSTTENFQVENSKAGNIRIGNSTTGQFNILRSTIGDISIEKNSITRRFWFEDSTIGVYSIYNSTASILSFKDKSRSTEIYVWYSSLQRIQVRSGSFVGRLKCQFNLHNPVHLVLEESFFAYLDLENAVLPEFTTLNLSECAINQMSLDNFCNYGTVFFSSLKPLETWEDFKKDELELPIFSEGAFQFETISRLSTLRLTDSDLGKMQFINCDLRKFERFEFSNTKMLDVFVAGSQMPEDKAFLLPGEKEELKKPLTTEELNDLKRKKAEQKRLAYGQFKKIYEARGDVAGSLPYLAYEMEAYREQLERESTWKNRGELFMLWMNKLSTNYGVSWQRGLIVTLLAVIFFYSIFCYLIGYRFENNSPDDVDRFWKLVSYAPYYLNPLRDLDSVSLVKDEDFTPWTRIWDFFSRIFVAYFVYQTIQAFRKLGKSSG